MYNIKPYSYEQARKLNVTIKPSKRKNKKIDVFDNKGNYIVSIGDINFKDYPTYIEDEGKEFAMKRRTLYQIRHKGENLKKGTAGYYAWFILW